MNPKNLTVCEIVAGLEYTRKRIVRTERGMRRRNLSSEQREGMHKLLLNLETQWDAWQAAFDRAIPFAKNADATEPGL